MIKTEVLSNGLIRTYSDSGMKVERDGVLYDEAIDPQNEGRVYTESAEPVELPLEFEYLGYLSDLGVDTSGA